MIYAVYFVPREGVHPEVGLEMYAKMWPIMMRSVHRLGHQLVHLTDMYTESWGDLVHRVDVDPETTVYSRDVAWAKYIERLTGDEQAMMLEPDTVMMREVPPIKDGCDLVVLRRPQSCVPGWFRLGKRSSLPFYQEVVANYRGLTHAQHCFHGDIGAMHRTLGIADGEKAHTIPGEAAGCKIEVRDWDRYGFRKGRDPYLLQFKGHSKDQMLRLAP